MLFRSRAGPIGLGEVLPEETISHTITLQFHTNLGLEQSMSTSTRFDDEPAAPAPSTTHWLLRHARREGAVRPAQRFLNRRRVHVAGGNTGVRGLDGTEGEPKGPARDGRRVG